MNIMRETPREYTLIYSLKDPNIKIRKHYRDNEEINKDEIEDLDDDTYVEWRILPSNINDFFNCLLSCAVDGLFEDDNIEEVKNILENVNIPLGQKFLEEKLINKEDIGDMLDILSDVYLKEESKKGIDFLFRSQALTNGKSVIFRVAIDEKYQIIFSVFLYYNSTMFFGDEYRQDISTDDAFMTTCIDICKILLCINKTIHKETITKLQKIKPILNKIEKQRENIKDSFGLDLNQCLISKDVGVENAYTIIPIEDNQEIFINTIKGYDIFNRYNLAFEYCIFKDAFLTMYI